MFAYHLRVLLLAFVCLPVTVWGQWNSPSVDNPAVSINTDDYGIGNVNNYGTGTQRWYMTWDNTYLYIYLEDANETEYGIVYLDLNPIIPINGGNNIDGSLTGRAFNGLGAPDLPFRADAFLAFNNSDRQIYVSDNAGGWSFVRSGANGFSGVTSSDDYTENFYASNDRGNGANGDDDREFRVAWSDINGGAGLPTQFAWLGYVSYTNGMYGDVPSENPDGTFTAGSSQDLSYYMNVSSTGDGTSSNPMSQISYCHLGGTQNFGGVTVFDFTLNQPGVTLTRENTGPGAGFWDIAGNLVIHDGTVDHDGTVNTDIDVDGSVIIGSAGRLDLELSVIGADLFVGGNFTNNGTFECNERAVFFDANGNNTQQTIDGSALVFIDYMYVTTTGDVSLQNNLYIRDTLDLTNATGGYSIICNDFDLIIQANALILNAGSGSYVVTNGLGNFTIENIGTSTTGRNPLDFPMGPDLSTYTPVTINNNVSGSSNFDLRVCGNVTIDGQCTGTNITSNGTDVTWYIGHDDPTPDFNAIFSWPGTVHLSGFNPTTALLNSQFPGTGSWTLEAGPINAGAGPTYSATGSNLSSTPFTAFSFSSNGILLDIEYLAFTARPQPEGVQLDWHVMEDPNTERYALERSLDGVNWTAIHERWVSGSGQEERYQYLDREPFTGENYYRVVGELSNGEIYLSPIRTVQWEKGQPALTAYPNPAQGTVHLQWDEALNGTPVRLFNALGQVVQQFTLNNNHHTLSLPAGVYFLNETTSHTTLKIIVYE